MGLKTLANGFFFTPKAVVKDFSGVLEVFIYAVSMLALSPRKIESYDCIH